MASNPGWLGMSFVAQQASRVHLSVGVIAILNTAVFGPTRCTLPYIAGFLDGDGTSSVNAACENGGVVFSQSSSSFLQLLCASLVALVGVPPKNVQLNTNQGPFVGLFSQGEQPHKVSWYGAEAISILTALHPYLVCRFHVATMIMVYFSVIQLPAIATLLNDFKQRRRINNQWDSAPGGRNGPPRVAGPTESNQDGANWLNWQPVGFAIPPFAK